MFKNKTIALVGCSDGRKKDWKPKLEKLVALLESLGLKVKIGKYLFETEDIFSRTGKDRAEELNEFYRDDEVNAIFDISGGNVANETIEFIDFEEIKNSDKMYYGYSDLTTIITSIYSKTGKSSGLYQIRNLLYSDEVNQIEYFKDSILSDGNKLFSFNYEFFRGTSMKGQVLGGNLRCLLKLAGTEYFPDFDNKIIFIEGLGGLLPQFITMFTQLRMLGVFENAAGLIVGNFTEIQENKFDDKLMELVLEYVPQDIPIVRAMEIGHQVDSKAIMIGDHIDLNKN